MPLPGGPADKIGNRYESWWTVYQLVRMLQGSAESIRIENPGVDEAEFVLAVGPHREWHQAKRSHPSGRWTISTLMGSDVKVIQGIGTLLQGNADRFVFVSTTEARELAELSERARQATTADEFERAFLGSKDHADNFAKLLKAWSTDLPSAYDCLRRIAVRALDERTIEELSHAGITAAYLGNPNDLADALRAAAADSVHIVVTRLALIAKLAARGFLMRRAVRPESAAAAVEDATRRYLEGVRGKLIRQTLIPRTETRSLLAILGDRGRDAVLTGGAGSGKTGCVLEFIDELRRRGVPVLALRLDRIDPASTAESLGRNADLEESPALVLAAAAQGREAVLVIDQLDAVSTTSGRSTGFFEAVEGTLTEVRGLRERADIHVVVVCREFDWENDHRFKKLLADGSHRVRVGVLSADRTNELLAAGGFTPALFVARQLELLRLPQNLSMFLEGGFDPAHTPMFNTAAELFDRYWTAKRRAVRDRVGRAGDRWMDVIGVLIGEMTRTQQLFVARERLDTIDPDYVEQMTSEGVMTFDGRRYGFGHESFFDYCFARSFVGHRDTLVDLLTPSEQHLFRRSQVRQVLTYMRDADRGRYLRELNGVLTDSRVRSHIKDVAFALLASVVDPSEDEWTILEPLVRPMIKAIESGSLKEVDKIVALSWQHFLGSRSWFNFAGTKRLFQTWLAADGPVADMAVGALRFHERHAPDTVAELLEPYADGGGDWPRRLRFLMEWSGHTTSRRLFDLTLRLIDNGVLDAAKGPIAVNSTFWSIFHGLGKERPGWASEVTAHWLRRRMSVSASNDDDFGRADLFGYDQFAEEPIREAATNAPREFVERVLPPLLEISDRAVYKDGPPPKHDRVWPSLMKSEHPGVEGACLEGMDSALTILAREGHDLCAVIRELRRRDTYVANHLLQVLYTAGADRYADEAAAMLVAEPWRFECGYSDSSHWTSTELVRAIASRCDTDVRGSLEAAILAYASPWERTKRGYKSAGFASFSILSAFPPDLRSSAGATRFGELERKFGDAALAPRGITAWIVQSPIGKEAAEKMTDTQWLRAIAKYDSEHRFNAVGDGLKGGAWLLAQSLETLVTHQPERFVRLALQLPAEANAIYLNRILAGIEKPTIPIELKLAVCRKAFADAREECGRSIADVLGACEDTLPDDAVDMLVWLATEHPDPDHEAWKIDAGGGRTYFNGDIYTNGINTTRGNAAEAIRDLVWRDAAYLPRFRSSLERIVRDPSTCVLSCVAGALRAVAYHDAGLALALFRMMDVSEERLLATVHVYDFIYSMLRDHFDDVRPTIETLLRSGFADVSEAGARLVALAALLHERAADLEVEALRGNLSQRRGLAQIAAANVAADDFRDKCAERLTAFFNDDDQDVRKEAADSFRSLRDESLERYEPLILAFAESVSYRDDSMSVLHLLENSLGRLPGITCVICEKFLERFSDDARDIRSTRTGDARTVTQLVFRTYHQHQQDEWTGRALDLIDRLCLEGIRDAGEELERFDR